MKYLNGLWKTKDLRFRRLQFRLFWNIPYGTPGLMSCLDEMIEWEMKNVH